MTLLLLGGSFIPFHSSGILYPSNVKIHMRRAKQGAAFSILEIHIYIHTKRGTQLWKPDVRKPSQPIALYFNFHVPLKSPTLM